MDVLIDADTIRSPTLRHEVPVSILDPFLYGECDGAPWALVSPLDADLIAAARPELRRLDIVADFGLLDLIDGGMARYAALLEVRVLACREMGVTGAAVPPDFPLATAEALRAAGIELQVDVAHFEERRRRKTPEELAGIRRAIAAAEAGLTAAREAMRSLPLTCEELETIVRTAVEATGAALGDFIVTRGPQTATGHGPGYGAIRPGEPVIVDLWPQDRATGCFADVARTFVAGQPDPEIARWHALVVEALERAIAAVRPGVRGSDLWRMNREFLEAAGEAPEPYALGHGVGLEVHEEPSLGRGGGELRAGDVISVEPFLGREGFGGVQVEDMLLVTDDGCARLSTLSP